MISSFANITLFFQFVLLVIVILCYHNRIVQLVHKITNADEVLTESFYPIIAIQWRFIDQGTALNVPILTNILQGCAAQSSARECVRVCDLSMPYMWNKRHCECVCTPSLHLFEHKTKAFKTSNGRPMLILFTFF